MEKGEGRKVEGKVEGKKKSRASEREKERREKGEKGLAQAESHKEWRSWVDGMDRGGWWRRVDTAESEYHDTPSARNRYGDGQGDRNYHHSCCLSVFFLFFFLFRERRHREAHVALRIRDYEFLER